MYTSNRYLGRSPKTPLPIISGRGARRGGNRSAWSAINPGVVDRRRSTPSAQHLQHPLLCSIALPKLDLAMLAEGKHHLPKLAPPPAGCMKYCWLLSSGAASSCDPTNKLTIIE